MQQNDTVNNSNNNNSELLSVCPSFNTYSSEAANKLILELNKSSLNDNVSLNEEFEFSSSFLDTEKDFPPQTFPIFDRNLLLLEDSQPAASGSVEISLRKLFLDDERDGDRDIPSSSSSEADELDGVSPATYCVWTPKSPSPAPSPGRCEKSKSTGSSSKRWRLRDLLLRRSNSDGKESFVFLANPSPAAKSEKVAGKSKGKSKGAHEIFYEKNRAVKEGDKRKSYLPYRKDLVGLGFFR